MLLLFVFAEVIINPIGNFPLNDDWWYAKLYFQIFEEKNFQNLNWGSASLIAQLFISKTFVFLFGFSHTVLRFSTLCLSFLSVIFFFKIMTRHLNLKPINAFLVCVILIFNPIFLCLSNSYMTDIPFICFLSGGFYFYLEYLKNKKSVHFLMALLMFVLAILTRQIALAFLLAILVSQVIERKKWNAAIIILLVMPLILLFLFEWWLKQNTNNMAYAFVYPVSSARLDTVDFRLLFINISKRWVHYLSLSGLMLSPILVPCLVSVLFSKKMKFKLIATSLLFIPVLISIFKFPIGNYLYNCGVGPDTLYDVYILKLNTASQQFDSLFLIIKSLASIGAFALILFLIVSVEQYFITAFDKENKHHVFRLFFIAIVLYYVLMCLRDSIFDRYILVAFCFLILFISDQLFAVKFNKTFFLGLITCLMIFSIAATSDYMNLNRIKWMTVDYLKNKNKVKDEQINAGYEHAGITSPEHINWFEKWKNTQPHLYVIAHGPIKDYYTFSYFTYQKFMPFKTDTLFILKRK